MILDSNSVVPLYYQLREIIRERILTGQWEEETELPSEKELMDELGVSRQTVRLALAGLVDDGLIYRRKGKGTYVATQRLPGYLKGDKLFVQEAIRHGGKPTSELVFAGRIHADETTKSLIDCGCRDSVFKIQRMWKYNGVPVVLENLILCEQYMQNIEQEDLSSVAVIEYVEKHNGIRFAEIKTTIQVTYPEKEISERMSITESLPLLCLRNTALLDATPVIFNEKLMRGDKFIYSLNYQLGKMEGTNPKLHFHG